ncbi:MAG: TetR/AcrR family transcriptional regulator [Solirubrobacterales bacterium]
MEARMKAPRRTQAERRARTQAALLDATIDCLVEFGFAGTTTGRIVERAGVSRGAQVHHYPTKAQLVAEAVRHLASRRLTEFFEDVATAVPPGRDRLGQLLDRVWAIHLSPLFAASMELIVAARTDPELRDRMVDVERDVTQSIAAALAGLFPDLAADRAFRESIETELAAARGMAILSYVSPEAELEPRWLGVRAQLLKMLEDSAENALDT